MAHKNQALQWACELKAEPVRVLPKEQVELTLSLSHQKFGQFKLPARASERQAFEAFYEALDYIFDADHPDLRTVLKPLQPQFQTVHAGTTEDYRELPFFTFKMPPIADGSWVITVTIERGNLLNRITDISRPLGIDDDVLESFPAKISASTTIRNAKLYSESRADVTLQRSLSIPTNDEGLWVAIRNRTVAVEFQRYRNFIDSLFGQRVTGVLNEFEPVDPRPQNDESASNNVAGGLGNSVDNRVHGFIEGIRNSPALNIYGPYAYNVLKLATQAFLMLEAGVVIEESRYGRKSLLDPNSLEKERIRLNDPAASFEALKSKLGLYLSQSEQGGGVLPYLDRILNNLLTLDRDQGEVVEVLPYFNGVLQHRLTSPSLIELIWSYWHEEGMLVQTMNAIALRFQNRRSSPHDPLGELELDPLRPLNNLIWGHIQEEHNRLTVQRRAYEYQHHYGLSLVGKAVSGMIPADVRSKFLQAFHNLLYRAAVFYREDQDTTIIADTFPLLNALREVHLLLAEGAHNQFGDLPWTARGEMLVMQWMLARPEMREFLRGRYMVPYQETWMGAVDCMKKLQGWTDTTVTHFHEMAVTGERILLSIRYGDWIEIENTQEQAKNWARYWKPEIQRYIHGYMTATGVDLMADITDNRDAATRYLQPSTLLQQRLEEQTGRKALSAPRLVGASSTVQAAFTELPRPQPRSRALRYQRDSE